MKNNEIMVSARFIGENDKKERFNEEISVLVLKSISLKALIEAFFYGLEKNPNQKQLLELLTDYLKRRKQLQVLYTARGKHSVIDFTEEIDDVPIYEQSLDSLGFVTSSCLLFTMDLTVNPMALFTDPENSYILRRDDTLEYNISTRRLNVIEPSVIEILPPGDMPKKERTSLKDVLIPTLLSAGGMIGARLLMTTLADGSSSSMGSTMMLMSGAMAVVALFTATYNYFKKRSDYRENLAEWKTNYENYIKRIIDRIEDWQDSDIKYLNSTYPNMGILFKNTAKIDGSIFSRSQNDNDFMRVTLGPSDEVEPLFEIKNEAKDNIINEVYYVKKGDEIVIMAPSKAEKKRKKLLSEDENRFEENHKQLLTDLPSVFANKGVDPEDNNNVVGFHYLRSDPNRKQSIAQAEAQPEAKRKPDLAGLLKRGRKKAAEGENEQPRAMQSKEQGPRMKPPLLLDLRDCGALGVVSTDDELSQNFIRHMVFELAYYHSPEDLQFVFFFSPEEDIAKQDRLLRYYKNLPHANELLDGVSQFVFDKDSAGVVFGQLLSIMNGRAKERSEEKEDEEAARPKVTQIVCVVLHDYKIKETGFSKYLPEVPKEGEPYVNENGLTFIFVQQEKDLLPKYCGNIVEIDSKNNKERRCSLRYNILSRTTLNLLSETGQDRSDQKSASEAKASTTDKLIEYKHFDNDYIFKDSEDLQKQFELAYRQLSAIYYTRIAENGKVPSMVTLFKLYGIKNEEDVGALIEDNWNGEPKNDKEKNEKDVTRNLRVPIGANEHGAVALDLYEKADGPHMLVAGTTGSGKSETIITYLIGLCMKFKPIDLNLMLVDMKGGGFSDRLGNLPHCVGVVTDTAGEDEGTSAAYMLKRFLEALNAEIKRRKLLLTSFGVDNVDAYMRAYRAIKKIQDQIKAGEDAAIIEKAKKKLNDKQREALENENAELVPLSHLVLVVDEFTELKRFSSESDDVDFIAEITTIARVGRTLGFHIILVSQNIEGAITDDIRVNSKARICLKVATKQASKEMLGSPVAAAPSMPLNGRAYLLVGTGSRFEYFQSAYTGANKNQSIEDPVVVSKVPNSGRFDPKFYESNKDNYSEKKKRESINDNDTQLAFVVNTIIEMGKNDSVEKPLQIFLPPLASRIVDATEWRM